MDAIQSIIRVSYICDAYCFDKNGDFDLPKRDDIKMQLADRIVLFVSVFGVLLAIGCILFFPLYFLIKEPWWGPYLIVIVCLLSIVIFSSIDSKVRVMKNKHQTKIAIDAAKQKFINILIENLNFEIESQ